MKAVRFARTVQFDRGSTLGADRRTDVTVGAVPVFASCRNSDRTLTELTERRFTACTIKK